MAASNSSKFEQTGLLCVTGNWGLLGCSIIRLLLSKGYHVRCTIRITPEEAAELMASSEAEVRLELVHADLLSYNSLSKAINGCEGVFHVPAPHEVIGTREYPEDMIEHEVKGALNVAEVCANSSTVKRLVMTSCLSTIIFGGRQEQIIDEKCWSNMEFCKDKKLWSPLAKTLAERAAWSLAVDKELDMVVINLATVVGPTSVSKALAASQGLKGIPNDQLFAYVHLEDAAKTHVLAMENPRASGRYICFERIITGSDLRGFSPRSLRSAEPCHHQILSNQKLAKLGLQLS